MHLSLEGRVAVVTGSARGIGRAIARKLAERGANVVLADLEEPVETAEMIGEAALPLAIDVSLDTHWGRLGEEIDRKFGRADIVVNNAAFYPFALFDQLDYDTWRRTMAVNLDAHFLSAKHFVPRMRKNGWGRFVSIASNSIGTAEVGLSHYITSKMGAIGFVRGLANEVAADGITANAVLPSLTETDATAAMPEEHKRMIWQQQAIKRLAQPEDITGAVAFLASDDAAFVTGQALVVDGGLYKIS